MTNAFNDRGWVVRDSYWLQRLFEDKLRLLIGRADTSDFFGQQPIQSINALFVNRHFSANPTVPFPGHGPTVWLLRGSQRPVLPDNGRGQRHQQYAKKSELNSIDEGDFFYTAEAGFTPFIEGMGRGRYSIMGWYIAQRVRDTSSRRTTALLWSPASS